MTVTVAVSEPSAISGPVVERVEFPETATPGTAVSENVTVARPVAARSGSTEDCLPTTIVLAPIAVPRVNGEEALPDPLVVATGNPAVPPPEPIVKVTQLLMQCCYCSDRPYGRYGCNRSGNGRILTTTRRDVEVIGCIGNSGGYDRDRRFALKAKSGNAVVSRATTSVLAPTTVPSV